jgi:hypothetical protein
VQLQPPKVLCSSNTYMSGLGHRVGPFRLHLLNLYVSFNANRRALSPHKLEGTPILQGVGALVMPHVQDKMVKRFGSLNVPPCITD